MKKNRTSGVTLIELLIVIGIISILLQLALPAVQMARESARRTNCMNNLRQLAVGAQLHLNSQEHFPSGGWTYKWVGDPRRGFGKDQPGGWCYNLLPFIEQKDLHDLGRGLPDAERRKLGAKMFATALPVFTCTSRHLVKPRPFLKLLTCVNIDVLDLDRAGRSDYAASIGNLVLNETVISPQSLEEGDQWEVIEGAGAGWINTHLNGITYQRSEVTPQMVEDGLSNTYLYGEKFIRLESYKDDSSGVDDQSLYIGFSIDNLRMCGTEYPPNRDTTLEIDLSSENFGFGSAHPAGLHMALCDGSVRRISYDIDVQIYSAMSTRAGGEIDTPDE